MGNYSKEEIEEFKAKDIRISRSGIVQALIQSGVFTYDQIIDSGLIKATAEAYLRWVWDEKEPVKAVELPCEEAKTFTWVEEAKKLSLPIPNSQEVSTLNLIWLKYRQISNVDVTKLNASNLLQALIKKFNKYPSKESSVSIVMESIPLDSLI